jgi:hypothetical protein
VFRFWPVRLALLFAAGLALLLFLAGLCSGGLELVVKPVKGRAPLLVLPLRPGERFTIHYFHSVEDAPIWEEHSLDSKGVIHIEEERYLKFGAGMGRMPGVGRMVMRGPYEAIADMHHPVGDFVLRVGSPGVDHTVIWRGIRTNLSSLIPGQAVVFQGRPVSLLYRWWRRLFPHPATPCSDAP